MMILYTLLREILKVRVLTKYYKNFLKNILIVYVRKNYEIIIFFKSYSTDNKYYWMEKFS